jgi:hypothetical protein
MIANIDSKFAGKRTPRPKGDAALERALAAPPGSTIQADGLR